MNVREAARRMEVSLSTIYALVAAGKLRHIRVGVRRGAIRISEEQILEFMKGAEATVAPAPPYQPGVRLKHINLK